MARIYIEPSRAKRTAQDELDLSRALKAMSQEVDGIRNNMRYKIAGRAQIAERLRQVSEQSAAEAGAARNMGNGLQQIVAWYEKTENGNRDNQTAEKAKVRKGAEEIPFDWGELLKKVIETTLGPFGIITNIPDIMDGEEGSVIKHMLDGIGSITDVVDAEGGTAAEWLKDLFGLNPMEFTSFGDTFLDKIGKFDSPASSIGTVANWAGKLVDSFVKNAEEFAGNWCARFWEETFTEAGIKLVEGAAVSAGVSAAVAGICTAVGVACPPALVVGVVAAGATMLLDWGLDSLVSWATGGSETSWIEHVSDRICDGIDAIRETVGPAVEKAGQVINDGIDAVVDTGRKVVDSVKDGISNIFSGRWLPCLAN